MKRIALLGAFLLVTSVTSVTSVATAAVEPLPPVEAYAGSEACKKCHEDKYEGWKNTFHSTVVQDAKANPKAILGDFSQSGIGFSKEDIEYTIGGHWNQRYMKKIGDDYYILPKAWSVSSRRWEPYNVWGWRKKPYSKNCVGCHVTRFDPSDGSFTEHTISCETCHGPGQDHVDSDGDITKIVHPNKLGAVDGMEMICASCHVRGTDPSGEYQFAVGFVPGRDLTDYYIPRDMEEGETPKEAILRQFRKWWGNAGNETECKVCGIFPKESEEKQKPKSKTEYCMTCHKYGDEYNLHSNHDNELKLECFDCHKQLSIEIDEEETEDVHSVSYFLVHKKTCYDKDYAKACKGCHEDKTDEEFKAQLLFWQGRAPVHE